MRKIKQLIFLLLFPIIFTAQNNPELTPKIKSAVVENISQSLLNSYVFPDTAQKMVNYIKQQLKAGAYNKITNPSEFGNEIIKDLYSVHRDLHLQILYNSLFIKEPADNAAINQPSDEDRFKKVIQSNFGFKKVEVLNGNIGYIYLENFSADTVYGKQTLKAALNFVANTNALIIDLRNNGGGMGATVSMILSYFFKDKVHVTDIYNRPDNTTLSFYTSPDASLTQFINMPIYVLTSNKTFSAAEEFTYDLQCLKRSTTIGEVTGGGAHPVFDRYVGYGYQLKIPYGRAINPITKSNWESIGVKPDIIVPADKALETAEMKIFESLISTTKDSTELYDLNWQFDLLQAANHSITIDTAILKKYIGTYGDRTFTLENGKLFYQRISKPKFEMEAMTPTIFKGKGNTYFKIEFIENPQGQVFKLKAHYQDHRIEVANRTK